jgi:hypothetical protein
MKLVDNKIDIVVIVISIAIVFFVLTGICSAKYLPFMFLGLLVWVGNKIYQDFYKKK